VVCCVEREVCRVVSQDWVGALVRCVVGLCEGGGPGVVCLR
jgi:hypothetical protein